jgi:hypothetical protein
MGGGSVFWAETPGADREDTPGPETRADVDETFAARRLRRWLKGMFGGPAKRPVRDSAPVERDRGNRDVPPRDAEG